LVVTVVGVAVLPGGPLFEVAVPAEVFGVPRPGLIEPPYELRLCRVGDQPIHTTGGLTLTCPFSVSDLAACDTVVVPALPEFDSTPPPDLVEAVQLASARGARIVSICTGAFALAAAGVLDGLRATTHWMYVDALRQRYPRVRVLPDSLYTVDGNVLTSAGTAAALDLCIEIVRQDRGAGVANDLARRLVTPPHRDGDQAQCVTSSVKAAASRSPASILDWIQRHLCDELTLEDLAVAAGLSTRTLARRFDDEVGMSPMRWLTMQRIRLAQELLEQTDLPLRQVAELSGLGSAQNLRAHFTRLTHVSPIAYRRQFEVPKPVDRVGRTKQPHGLAQRLDYPGFGREAPAQ